MATADAVSLSRTPPPSATSNHGPIFHFPANNNTTTTTTTRNTTNSCFSAPHSPAADRSSSEEDTENNNENDNRYSFTPQRRLPHGPRAWQRQPAQPFAPRNEAQKIWKRAPLKAVTPAEINAKWKRSAGEDDGVARPAKRLKMLTGGKGGKENEEISEAWCLESLPPAVGEVVPEELDPDEARRGGNVEEEGETFEGVHSIEESASPVTASVSTDEMADEGIPKSVVDERQGLPTEPVGLMGEQCESASDMSETSTQDGDNPHAETVAAYGTDIGHDLQTTTSEEAEQPAVNDLSVAVNGRAPPPVSMPEMCFDVTASLARTVAGSETETSEQALETPRPFDDKAGQIGELQPANELTLSASEEAALSFAKPGVTEAEHKNDTLTSLAASQALRPVNPPEEDDTAFLQQFLQRAKQARAKNPSLQLYRPVGEQIKQHLIDQHNSTSTASPKKAHRKRPLSPDPEDLSNLDSPEEPTITSTVLLPGLEQPPEKPPSPSRRSNRLNANTKLPRPQRPTTLPSNISLRRLNGSEFISMAKQRSEAQSASMVTRTNTRKNKGSAMSRREKLQQIKVGFSDHPTDQTSAKNSQEQKKTKVRNKTGVAYDRVSWDPKLARYRKAKQEFTLLPDGRWESAPLTHGSVMELDSDDADDQERTSVEPNEVDQSQQGHAALKSTPKKSKQPSSSSSFSSTSSSSSSSKTAKTLAPKTQADSTAESELSAPALPSVSKPPSSVSSSASSSTNTSTKRKRVQTTGSVNGTPAPKRGMDVLLGEARENEGVVNALGRGGTDNGVDTDGGEGMGGAVGGKGNGVDGEGEGGAAEASKAQTRGSKRLKAKRSMG